MIDKQKATELRQEGLSYQEIAKILGCSIQWCKVNLKNVQKNTKEKELIEKCIELGLRPEGISTIEIRHQIVKSYPEMSESGGLTEDGLKMYKKIKVKIREKDGTIVRPAWLVPTNVDQVFKAVIQAVDNIDRRVDEEIRGVMRVINPSIKESEFVYKSLESQIFNLTHLGRFFSKKEIGVIISSLENTIIELRKRVPQEPHEFKQIDLMDLDDDTKEKIF